MDLVNDYFLVNYAKENKLIVNNNSVCIKSKDSIFFRIFASQGGVYDVDVSGILSVASKQFFLEAFKNKVISINQRNEVSFKYQARNRKRDGMIEDFEEFSKFFVENEIEVIDFDLSMFGQVSDDIVKEARYRRMSGRFYLVFMLFFAGVLSSSHKLLSQSFQVQNLLALVLMLFLGVGLIVLLQSKDVVTPRHLLLLDDGEYSYSKVLLLLIPFLYFILLFILR